MLTSILGLDPEAFEARLRIVRPMLPENVNRLEIYDLRVGTASVDLIFERASGAVTTRVQEKRGSLRNHYGRDGLTKGPPILTTKPHLTNREKGQLWQNEISEASVYKVWR